MREQIKIDINKDGTVITIGGEKSIEEMIMVGWKVYKKGIETRKFRKGFRIPDGVILDNINANFNEDEYMLTILLPKKVKGIVGIEIEEMVEPEAVIQDSETLPATSKNIKKRVTFKEESIRNPKQKITEERGDASSQVNGIESADSQFGQPKEKDVADNKMSHNKDREVVQEHSTNRGDDNTSEEKLGKQTNQETPKPDQICEKVESLGLKQQKDQDQEKDDQVNGKQVHHEKEKTEAQAKTQESQKKSKIFAPLIVGGSAMLVSLVAYAIHATQTKKEHAKRKD